MVFVVASLGSVAGMQLAIADFGITEAIDSLSAGKTGSGVTASFVVVIPDKFMAELQPVRFFSPGI